MHSLALLALLVGGSPVTETSSSTAKWRYSTSIVTRTLVTGYESARIVSSDGDIRFIAANQQKAWSTVRARLRVEGDWFRLDVEPYTAIPTAEFRVNLGGVEINTLVPIADLGYVGYYHRSEHNFSVENLGYGTNLNAIVLDFHPWKGDLTLWDRQGKGLVRLMSHMYVSGEGSPYAFTRDTDVDSTEIGETKWMALAGFWMVHPEVRSECDVRTYASERRMASLRLDCSGTVSIGKWFPGTAAEMVFVGPFATFAQNLSRHAAFGKRTYAAGVRLDLVIAENAFLP